MITLFINLIGLSLIGVIFWWFILKKPAPVIAVERKQKIIIRDGVYTPSVIKAKRNKSIILEFIREDKSPCAKVVIFKNLDINKELPVNRPTSITLNNLKPGTYSFSCQMGMYQGSLIIE